MAGLYDDAPSRRMAWDADGSLFFQQKGGALIEHGSTTRANLNNENNARYITTQTGSESGVFISMHPEPREVDGIFVSQWWASNSQINFQSMQVSDDTTNGIDGSWVQQVSDMPNEVNTTQPGYRDDIISLATSQIRGVRVFYSLGLSPTSVGLATWHVYGLISPGETPDRILFLDTENSDAVFTKVLDFGDVPRGQTTTRTFKIKNNSSTLSINTIQITAEDLHLNAGDWYEFGDGGGSFQATYAIGNLANGAEETIHLKQVIPGGETLGIQAGRIKVSHADLT